MKPGLKMMPKLAAALEVQEETINGQRLLHFERHDLKKRVEGDDYTAMRRQVTADLQASGYIVVSCNFVGDKKKMVAIIRRVRDQKPQSPLLYKPNPIPLKVTAAGRVRK